MSFGLIREYVPDESEIPEEQRWWNSPAYLKEKAEREGKEYVPMYSSSVDTVERLIAESKELREALNPKPIAVGQSLAEDQAQRNYKNAVIVLRQAAKDLSRYTKVENILGIVRDALQE